MFTKTLALLQATIKVLMYDPIYGSCHARHDLYPLLPEKFLRPRTHPARYDAADAAFAEKSGQKTRFMSRVRQSPFAGNSAVFDFENRVLRAPTEMKSHFTALTRDSYLHNYPPTEPNVIFFSYS